MTQNLPQQLAQKLVELVQQVKAEEPKPLPEPEQPRAIPS